jgi:hypothetical protein
VKWGYSVRLHDFPDGFIFAFATVLHWEQSEFSRFALQPRKDITAQKEQTLLFLDKRRIANLFFSGSLSIYEKGYSVRLHDSPDGFIFAFASVLQWEQSEFSRFALQPRTDITAQKRTDAPHSSTGKE